MRKTSTYLLFILLILLCIFSLVLVGGTRATSDDNAPSPGGKSQTEDESKTDDPSSLSLGPELIGRIGGTITPFAAAGGNLYAVEGPSLVVYDIATDPSHPRLVKRSAPIAANIVRIVRHHEYAFALGNSGHLWAVHLTDLTVIPIETTIPTETWSGGDLVAVGDILYVIWTRDGLHAVDISTPAASRYLGLIRASDPHGVAFAQAAATQGYLYIVARRRTNTETEAEVQVFDLTDRLAPALVHRFPVAQDSATASPFRVEKDHGYLFTSAGVHLYDLAQPAVPRHVGVYPIDRPTSGLATPDGHLYVRNRDGLQIVDISNPATPVAVGNLPPVGRLVVIGVAADGFLYEKLYPPGLVVTDVRTPSAPAYVHNQLVPSGAGRGRVVKAGRLLLSIEGTQSLDRAYALHILDGSNPVLPTYLGTFYSPINGIYGRFFEVTTWGRYALLATSNNFYIADLSHPDRPSEVYRRSPEAQIRVHGVAVAGHHVFLLQDDGLDVLDISRPWAPVDVGSVQWASERLWGHLFLSEQTLYTISVLGLDVYDIAQPSRPRAVGFLPMTLRDSSPFAGTVADGYLHIIGGEIVNGDASEQFERVLLTVDATDPAHPRVTSRIVYPRDGAYFPTSLAVAGDLLLVGGSQLSGQQIMLYDRSVPSAPTLLGSQELDSDWRDSPIALYDMEFADGLLYAALDGVSIFRVQPRVSAPIVPDGGQIHSHFDRTHTTWPAGTFTQPATVTHTTNLLPVPSLPLDRLVVGHVFSLQASDEATGAPITPARPYTISVSYDEAQVGAVREETLALYRWAQTAWVPVPSNQLAIDKNQVTAAPQQLGLFAVLGETNRFFLPAVD